MHADSRDPMDRRDVLFFGAGWVDDFRLTFRSLGRTHGFASAIVLTLALGMGAAAAIFSAADRILFRPPPYPNPQELVVVGYEDPRYGFLDTLLPVQLAAYREQAKSILAFAALESADVNLVVAGVPVGVTIGRISADYFGTLGAVPLLGRGFLPGEDHPGADRVVVLSEQLWRERFAADPAVLGRDVLLGGELCRVVGVVPKAFHPPGWQRPELYRPLVLKVDPANYWSTYFSVVARLQPAITAEQAQAELGAIKLPVSAWAEKTLADRKPRLIRLTEWNRRWTAGATQWALLGAVGCLYAIACTNAASLMLARLHGRRKELSVRLALGAGRGRLLRLILVENTVLTGLSALASVLVARWIFPVLLHLAPGGADALESEASLDWRPLAFTATLTILTVVLVSAAPAWRLTRSDIVAGLKEGAQVLGESPRLRIARSTLVVTEAALAVVLLVGAGLMARSVQRLQHLDRGFDPGNKAAAWLRLPADRYATVDARRPFYERLEEQLRAIPGVRGVAITSTVPMVGMSVVNLTKPDGSYYEAAPNPVTLGYREMLGLPLRRGRWFDAAALAGHRTVVLNETMARDFFGEENPIGRSLALPVGRELVPTEIIGVVADVVEQARKKARPQYYYPFWLDQPQPVASVLLRLNRPAGPPLADAVRRAVFAVDPLIATMRLVPLDAAAQQQVAQERYTLGVLAVLAGLALGLAVAGLFSVLTYAVSQRLGEFGLRLALGATPAQLSRLVLARGLALAATGVAVGSGVAWALVRLVQTLLYETSSIEPMVYISVAFLLLVAAGLGSWLPARRATLANLALLLRSE